MDHVEDLRPATGIFETGQDGTDLGFVLVCVVSAVYAYGVVAEQDLGDLIEEASVPPSDPSR